MCPLPMKIVQKNGRYEAIASFDERSSLKSVGFRWDNVSKVWFTPDAYVALRLSEYVEPSLRAHMQSQIKQQVAASKALDLNISIPKPDGLEYLPFQKAGISYALKHKDVLIADDMGLGKTVQAIGVYNSDQSIKTVLIVCPASLVLNWKREFEKWGLRNPIIRIATSTEPVPRSGNVVIFNYDIAQKLRRSIDECQWDLFIADECHMLKNPKAVRTIYVLGGKVKSNKRPAPGTENNRSSYLPPIQARRRLFLTGTPILNRPVELWKLVHTIDPTGLGADWRKFVVRYCNGKLSKYGWQTDGATNLDELQETLRSKFMVRRLKTDVLTELPGKRRVLIEVAASSQDSHNKIAEEKIAYEKNTQAIKKLNEEAARANISGNEAEYRRVLQNLKKAREIAFAEISRVRHSTALTKIPDIIEYLEGALESSDKIIVFAHHLDVIMAIAKHFGDQAVSLVGDNSPDERQAAVDRFQSDPTCRLFVGNIISAGVGYTLTAASFVVFVELDWRPGIVTQAEDRAYRIGQKNMVLVHHLVFEGSVDSIMARKIIAKQDVIDHALDTSNGPPDPLLSGTTPMNSLDWEG